PYGTELDEAPAIDSEFRVQHTGGQAQLASVGSTAVRDFVLERQPLLGLHGHVHESRGAVVLGRTLCLNPGSEYSEGVLAGALVTLADGRVASHQFVTGGAGRLPRRGRRRGQPEGRGRPPGGPAPGAGQ